MGIEIVLLLIEGSFVWSDTIFNFDISFLRQSNKRTWRIKGPEEWYEKTDDFILELIIKKIKKIKEKLKLFYGSFKDSKFQPKLF